MAVTVQTIRTRLPEFCAVDNQIIAAALASADACINRAQWGENRADEGTIWLTGHLLVHLAEGSALNSGPITSEREGGLAIGYAVSEAFKDSAYGSTSYGRQFLELRRTAFPERFLC
jgi:hypothetical protein